MSTILKIAEILSKVDDEKKMLHLEHEIQGH